MPRMTRILVLGTAIMLAGACSDPTVPIDDFELPGADLSLDPDRLSVGEYIATPCAFGLYGNRLDHLRGRNERTLVDVYFGRESTAGSWDGPNAGDIELVEAHGGMVLYHFNVPAVRARMDLSRIPDLVEEGFWVTVRAVPDPTRYDVPSLIVGFARPLRSADATLYSSLGGRVEHHWAFINALSGVLPDRSIPSIRQQSDIAYVEVGGVACVG
jgi:hypothetical protein